MHKKASPLIDIALLVLFCVLFAVLAYWGEESASNSHPPGNTHAGFQ